MYGTNDISALEIEFQEVVQICKNALEFTVAQLIMEIKGYGF